MIVADRYARSLMSLASEKGKVEEVKNDMRLVQKTVEENHGLALLLKSPVIKKDRKISVFSAIFEANIDGMSMAFIKLITSRNREKLLVQIAEAFLTQYKRDKNIFTAVVTSAHGLDDNTRKKMLELVRSQMNGEVELIEKVDKNTIGGFILRIGDRQLDKSVARQLSNLKKELVNKQLN